MLNAKNFTIFDENALKGAKKNQFLVTLKATLSI